MELSNIEQFYYDHQNQLDEDWAAHIEDHYQYYGNRDINNDDSFWDWVADQMERAKSISEGEL